MELCNATIPFFKILRQNYITPSLERESELHAVHYPEFSGYEKFQNSSFCFLLPNTCLLKVSSSKGLLRGPCSLNDSTSFVDPPGAILSEFELKTFQIASKFAHRLF